MTYGARDPAKGSGSRCVSRFKVQKLAQWSIQVQFRQDTLSQELRLGLANALLAGFFDDCHGSVFTET